MKTCENPPKRPLAAPFPRNPLQIHRGLAAGTKQMHGIKRWIQASFSLGALGPQSHVIFLGMWLAIRQLYGFLSHDLCFLIVSSKLGVTDEQFHCWLLHTSFCVE